MEFWHTIAMHAKGVKMNNEEILKRLSTAFPEIAVTALYPISNAIKSITAPTESSYLKNTIFDENEFNYLTSYILTHHAFSVHPLKKENFEYALEYIYKKSGKIVADSNDPTKRGADIVVDGRRFSLKTTSISGGNFPNGFDISKFAESRWMREPLANENFVEIHRLTLDAISSHLKEYDNVVTLINHTDDIKKIVTYKFYEVPKSIFGLSMKIDAQELSKMYFLEKNRRLSKSSKSPKPQTVSVNLMQGKDVACKLSLDGSVEKIRFLGVNLSMCKLLAEWKVTLTT